MNLRELMAVERKAWKRLMNDPRCIADPNASHTPELLKAWEDAAKACYRYREAHGLLGVHPVRGHGFPE